MVTVSSVEPINITIGRANTTPRMDMSTVAQKVNRSPWRTTRLAFSWSPRPRFLATRAVTPVFIETNAAISRNLGWVVNPTAASAWVPISRFSVPPMEPTIIRSTMDVSCVSRSSTKLGPAMRTMSSYSSRDRTPSGSFLLTFWSSGMPSGP